LDGYNIRILGAARGWCSIPSSAAAAATAAASAAERVKLSVPFVKQKVISEMRNDNIML